MKQSTAKLLINSVGGLGLIVAGTGICYLGQESFIPLLAGCISVNFGLLWIGCGIFLKCRACPPEPLIAPDEPLAFNCPLPVCSPCCEPQPETSNDNVDDPDVKCCDVMRCKL